MSQKSILEQALLQVQTLEEAVKQNAKGILASTMKQELNDLLKESLIEEEGMGLDVNEQPTPPEEEEKDVTGDEPADDETSITGDEEGEEEGAEDEEGTDDTDTEDYADVHDEEGDEPDADNAGGPSDHDADNADDETLDMTDASDDEVIKVFKAMKPEDGIVVKKEGNTLEVNDGDNQFIIKLDENESPEEGTEPIYEITLDEDDVTEVEATEGIEDGYKPEKFSYGSKPNEKGFSGDKKQGPKSVGTGSPKVDAFKKGENMNGKTKSVKSKEGEFSEAARTIGNGVRPPAQKMKFKAGRPEMNENVETINEEVKNLKKQNAEYKKALVLFKEKLNEVAVFNANLAYFTNLVTEHTTTKKEKMDILKRFDAVSSMNESKNLFVQIKTELGSKTTVTESVVNKISNTPSTSSSTEVLSESKAYMNPQFARMKDLMSKIK